MVEHKDKIRMSSKDYIPNVPYVDKGINLCWLPNGLICIGCCGFDFASELSKNMKKAFIKALLQNTEEYEKCNKDSIVFKGIYKSYDLHECGLCRKLIVDDKLPEKELMNEPRLKITCPLHPACNQGKELRKGECDPRYMCRTQRLFHLEWNEEKQKRFVDFVMSRNLDWFDYSVQMHTNSLLKEFSEM
jgi:hypothetical protein